MEAMIQRLLGKNSGIVIEWLDGLMPSILNFLLQGLIAIIVYLVGGRLIRFLVKLVHRSMDKAGTDEGVKQFVTPLIKYGLYLVLIFIIMGLFGIATTSAVAVLGSAGVAIGLALQGSLANFAGGVLILVLKPFRVGDYIIEDTKKNEGTVQEISIFYTKLVTADNKVIVIPNGMLSNSSLTNVSNAQERRVDMTVGISYEADIRTAKKLLFEVAQSDPARLQERDAEVFVSLLGDSSVDMGIRLWVPSQLYWETKFRLAENVKYALDDAGIFIPFRQVDVHIKQE
ncbi:MAG: mechanosensitive ion channel [Clostridiales bacterium]|nr:mechanosensitive ion channel [Clostridiales bacterium]